MLFINIKGEIMKKFIMYGAGNIGRGFIGQVFSQGGYEVGFIDVNQDFINAFNTNKEYPVDIVSNDGTEEQIVKNVYGIDGRDVELVSNEIMSADMMATAIGVNILKFIAKPLALGLKKRFLNNRPKFDIIICENLIGADEYLKGLIKAEIPEFADKVDSDIGFVEASIGRMVPVMTDEKRKGNVLRVCVEPYNVLPVDKNAFKGEIPEIKNLYPYSPFSLFIERKLFMHNMSHALCAYLGNLKGYEFLYQAVEDKEIRLIAKKALTDIAVAMSKEHGADIVSLIAHGDNLIYRFANIALADTVNRVGKDTIRKLSSNDRIIGALKLCEKYGVDCSAFAIGVASAMKFAPSDDERSIELSNFASENGASKTLEKYSEYAGKNVELIEKLYAMISSGSSLVELNEYCDNLREKEMKV